MTQETIRNVGVTPLEIPLETPFEISLGTQRYCRNVIVSVTTSKGVTGYGEAAPSAHVTGETPATVVAACDSVADSLVGRRVADYRGISNFLRGTLSGQCAARAGLESAVFDALSRIRGCSIADLVGGRDAPVLTDDTISLVDPERARGDAEHAASAGFDALKVKVGTDFETDVQRVLEVRDGAPDATIKADANQGYSVKEAVRFADVLQDHGVSLDLLEQPVRHDDLAGLAQVRDAVDVPVAADEALFTRDDALAIVERGAADVLNVKLAKSGVVEILDILSVARAANLDTMIGCMIETTVGISTAAHVVAGTGDFSYVDLDGNFSLETPLFEMPYTPDVDVLGPGIGLDVHVDDEFVPDPAPESA